MRALTPLPEAGARCGNAARRDLCGGRSVRAVPTATHRNAIQVELNKLKDANVCQHAEMLDLNGFITFVFNGIRTGPFYSSVIEKGWSACLLG